MEIEELKSEIKLLKSELSLSRALSLPHSLSLPNALSLSHDITIDNDKGQNYIMESEKIEKEINKKTNRLNDLMKGN